MFEKNWISPGQPAEFNQKLETETVTPHSYFYADTTVSHYYAVVIEGI